MNAQQRLWWDQVSSDHAVLLLLRKHGAHACQQLHYLQMVTEKLGKAYFWRTSQPPRKSHASFVRFLQALDNRPGDEVTRIAALLGFGNSETFEDWIRKIAPLAYDLERLAPSLAGDHGPNAEYPWPRAAPTDAPASYEFRIWEQLTLTASGRTLLKMIDTAVRCFPQYA